MAKPRLLLTNFFRMPVMSATGDTRPGFSLKASLQLPMSVAAFWRVSTAYPKFSKHRPSLAFSISSVIGAATILSTVAFACSAVDKASLTAATVRAWKDVAPDLSARDVQS
ncbi:JmjC domain, hydroxylase [Musa troglodytarum]|nr:JmjC domain, hydroxylase [Musa troglodytarum]